MLVAGAKRHAKEILDLFYQSEQFEDIVFFDDVTEDIGDKLYGRFKIIRSLKEVTEYFQTQNRFVLGLGNPKLRKLLSKKLIGAGGSLESIIANTAKIGGFNVLLGQGLNIMHFTLISNNVTIGNGTLVNAFCSVHHDVFVGDYCELSPHSALLGGCKIGHYTSIGSNATVLPDIIVGNHVVIGAGAVITKDIPDYSVVVGVPGKIIRKNYSS